MIEQNLKIVVEIKSKNSDFIHNSITSCVNADILNSLINKFKIDPIKELSGIICKELEMNFPYVFKIFPDQEIMTGTIRTEDGKINQLVNFEMLMEKSLSEKIKQEIWLVFIAQFKIDFEKFMNKLINSKRDKIC